MSYGKDDVAKLLGFSEGRSAERHMWCTVSSYSSGTATVRVGGSTVSCPSLVSLSSGDRALLLKMADGSAVVIGRKQ